MTTATKKEVKGTPGVNASQTKATEVKTNGKVNGTTAQAVAEKATPIPNSKPQTIEDHLRHFDGLDKLVRTRRALEKHKEAIAELELPDEVNDKFSNTKNGEIVITLMDRSGDEYEITNPRLVQDTREFLANIVDRELRSCNEKIMAYGN